MTTGTQRATSSLYCTLTVTTDTQRPTSSLLHKDPHLHCTLTVITDTHTGFIAGSTLRDMPQEEGAVTPPNYTFWQTLHLADLKQCSRNEVMSIGRFRGGGVRGVLTPPFPYISKIGWTHFSYISPIVFSFPALLLNISAASPFLGAKYWLHFLLLCCPQ